MAWKQIIIALIPAMLLSACDSGPEVDRVKARVGEIRESFSEPARTRLARRFNISMPLDGRIGRIELQPGDPVSRGQELVSVDRAPLQQAADEARAAVAELEQELVLNAYDEIEKSLRVELIATVDAAKDALLAADARVQAEQARTSRADKEHQRIRRLADKGSASQKQLDDAALSAETSTIGLREQQLMRAAYQTLFTAVKLGPEYIDEWLGRKQLQRVVISHKLSQAQARLARAEHQLALAEIRSPIDGLVLERHEQSAGPYPAGHALLSLGNTAELEVVAEVLTQDALRLRAGSEVILGDDGLGQAIAGKVKRIEPAAFTKLSSLGVEQQRVRVIAGLSQQPTELGVGYRLQARFFTASRAEALIVPRFSVLQSVDGAYYLFKLQNGKLQRQSVEVGLRNDLELEIRAGLSADDFIVATPDAQMKTGQSVSFKTD